MPKPFPDKQAVRRALLAAAGFGTLSLGVALWGRLTDEAESFLLAGPFILLPLAAMLAGLPFGAAGAQRTAAFAGYTAALSQLVCRLGYRQLERRSDAGDGSDGDRRGRHRGLISSVGPPGGHRGAGAAGRKEKKGNEQSPGLWLRALRLSKNEFFDRATSSTSWKPGVMASGFGLSKKRKKELIAALSGYVPLCTSCSCGCPADMV